MLENISDGGDARDARVERAVTLYLHGRRVNDIAAELGVSASSVRRWAREALRSLAEDERAERVAHLERAIESQRAVAAAAWEAWERERALDDALLRGDLDQVRRRAVRGPRRSATPRAPGDVSATAEEDDCGPMAVEEYERPKRSTQGPRYLSLAMAAQREVARLQGLYARLEATAPDVRITISRRPEGPENAPRALPSSDETDSAVDTGNDGEAR